VGSRVGRWGYLDAPHVDVDKRRARIGVGQRDVDALLPRDQDARGRVQGLRSRV